VLQDSLDKAAHIEQNNPLDKLKLLLPEVGNLRGLYKMATLETQHELIKAVFKGKLVYSDGVFRTPAIAPMFEVNTLVSMKKGCSFMSSPVKFGRQTRRVPGMGVEPTLPLRGTGF